MKCCSEQRLDVFETAWLRRILGSTPRDTLSNDAIKNISISRRIWQRHLRCFSHVMRINDGRSLKIALLAGVHGIR